MKKVILLLALLTLVVGGVFGWLHMTRVDRYLAALDAATDFDEEMADALLEHGDEGRVQKAIKASMIRRADPDYEVPYGSGADYYLIKEFCHASPPTPNEEMVLIIARLNALHQLSLKECLPGFDQDERVTSAYLEILIAELGKADSLNNGFKEVVGEVVRRNPPASQELISALIHAGGVLSIGAAEEYLDGLGPDPRLSAGLEIFLLATSKTKYNKGLRFLIRQFKRNPPAPKPELADAVAAIYVRWSKDGLESQELRDYMDKACEELALAIPGATERLRARLKSAAKGSDEAEALKKLVARIAPADSDVVPLLADGAEYKPDPGRSPIELTFEPNPRQKKVLASLLRLSKKTAPALRDVYLATYDWGKTHLSARALARMDPAMLAKATISQLRNYSQFHLPPAGGEPMERKLLNHYGVPAAAGLQALQPVKGHPDVDFAFMHALSCPDRAFAEYATEALKERLDRDEFVAALFSYLALKTSYSMYEVDVYKKALLTYPESSVAIARNLEKLIQNADGKPDKVPWIHKVIAMSCLLENGRPAARKTVEKYVGDPTGYSYVEFTLDENGKRKDERLTRKQFSDLARQTLTALDSRQ